MSHLLPAETNHPLPAEMSHPLPVETNHPLPAAIHFKAETGIKIAQIPRIRYTDSITPKRVR